MRRPPGPAILALGLLGLGLVLPAGAGAHAPAVRTPAREARVALVIGNAAYPGSPLEDPANDARSLGEALRGCGFQVTVLTDAGRQAMDDAIRIFGRQLQGGAVGLFYFAGHGAQVRGENFLLPVDAKLDEEYEIPFQGVAVDLVLDKMEAAGAGPHCLILDASRERPFARGWHQGRAMQGLAPMTAPAGTILASAARPGTQVAAAPGEHSRFTEALLAGLRGAGAKAEGLLKGVQLQVSEATAGQQVPWLASALPGDFPFRPTAGPVAEVRPAPAAKPVPWTGPAPVPGAHRNAQGYWEADLPLASSQIRMVALPPGTFRMGTRVTTIGWLQNARPVHTVTLTQAFWMGTCHVTQAQWEAVMGRNPSRFKGGDLPVENVSWDDCQQFVTRLNTLGKGTFRLPTEAEWEYACRAGTEGERYGDADAIAWYGGNSGKCTHPVGQKEPNAFGLHDMDGNSWQWVQDGFATYPSDPVTDPQGPARSSARVFRGASWHCTLPYVRSTRRKLANPAYRSWDLGLRLVRVLP